MNLRDLIKKFLGYYRKEVERKESPYGRYQAFLTATGYGPLTEFLKLEEELMARYVDYEEMDAMPELSSALDIYADDATIPNYQTGQTVWIEASDSRIKETLDSMLKQINIEDEIWGIARTLVKYGNDFEEIVLSPKGGVIGLNFLPPATVKVVVDKKGFPIGYCQSFSPYRRMTEQEFRSVLEGKTPLSKDEQVFEDWEVVHFKLGGRQRWDIYGVGILEPARWIWRRLMLLEDAILIYRLTRAPARRVFYVDVGNLPPDQALDYLEKVKAMYRKRKFVDPATGRLDFRYNPLSQDEDFFVPVRGGKRTTEIEVLSGMEYTGIEDLEYFRSKLFAALKIPKAYIGYEGEVTRATLSAEDVRFARTVMRIQREIRLGIRHICNVHLASFGIQPALVDFDVLMQVPSAILELAQVEILKSRAELAEALGNLFPVEWILQNVFHLSDAEIDNLLKALKKAEPEAVAVPPEEVETPGIEPFGVPERRFSPTPIERKVATPKEKRKVLFSQLIGYPFKGNGYKEVLEKLRENRKEFRILKGRVDQISRLLKDISNAVRGR